VNNCKNNTVRCLKQPALCKSARGCELPACIYDALGTTVGSKSNGKYPAAALSAFGEDLTVDSPTPTQNSNFFTGKPYVEGLGHAFLMRNYRAGLAKWQTADPLGYPGGWDQLAYCGNASVDSIDYLGAETISKTVRWDSSLWPDGEGGYSLSANYSFTLTVDYTLQATGNIPDIVINSVTGDFSVGYIEKLFTSYDSNGMSCSTEFTYGVVTYGWTFEARQISSALFRYRDATTNYVERSLKYDIYSHSYFKGAAGIGNFSVPVTPEIPLPEVLERWVDATIVHSCKKVTE